MKILRWIMGVTLVFSIIFSLCYGKDKISEQKEFVKSDSYKGIINMWNVDSFEGGEGSRRQFLMKIARTFEKSYKGVLIMVTDYSESSVKESFDKGVYPDIISYGGGTEIKNFRELNNVVNTKGGMIGNKLYATAWCKGGYVLIKNPDYKPTNKKDKLIISQQAYTQPMVAMALNDIKTTDYIIMKPMDAYINFVSGVSQYMIGTQRDIVRLKNRDKEVEIMSLNNFNDLYQYVSITTDDEEKLFYSQKFVELLMSEKSQLQLKSISMFSDVVNITYENENLNKMQNIPNKNTLSAFMTGDKLKELQSLAVKYYDGNESVINKIKNIVI